MTADSSRQALIESVLGEALRNLESRADYVVSEVCKDHGLTDSVDRMMSENTDVRDRLGYADGIRSAAMELRAVLAAALAAPDVPQGGDEGHGRKVTAWERCWDSIADAAWPTNNASRAYVLDLLLSVHPDPSLAADLNPFAPQAGDPS